MTNLVDPERIRDLQSQLDDFVFELIDLFADGSPPLADAMRDAVGRADQVALARAAHELKGSCLSVGATWIAEACQGLESAAPDAAAADAVRAIGEAIGPSVRELREAVGSGASDPSAR